MDLPGLHTRSADGGMSPDWFPLPTMRCSSGCRRVKLTCPASGGVQLTLYSGYAIQESMQWTVDTVAAVDTEIDSLPVALRARLVRLLELIEEVGLEQLRAPHVRHLEGKLWELRAKAQGGIARGIYVTATGRRVVVLHVFAKKSRKTPGRALDTARKRMKEVMR